MFKNVTSFLMRLKFHGIGHYKGWKSRYQLHLNYARSGFIESGCLGLQLKVGGKYLQKLNINKRPIAKKYREGKMKRTLKRESKSTWNRYKESVVCWCFGLLLSFAHGWNEQWSSSVDRLDLGKMFLEQLSGALISLPRSERFKRNPVLGPFLKINTKRFTTARLETRTKESYNSASICRFNRRMRSESKIALEHERGLFFLGRRIHSKHYCRDPKDGELCQNNLKPGESLVEECQRFWRANRSWDFGIGAKD